MLDGLGPGPEIEQTTERLCRPHRRPRRRPTLREELEQRLAIPAAARHDEANRELQQQRCFF